MDQCKKNAAVSDRKTYLIYRFDQPLGAEGPSVDGMGNTVADPGAVRRLAVKVKDGNPMDPFDDVDLR